MEPEVGVWRRYVLVAFRENSGQRKTEVRVGVMYGILSCVTGRDLGTESNRLIQAFCSHIPCELEIQKFSSRFRLLRVVLHESLQGAMREKTVSSLEAEQDDMGFDCDC